MITHNEPFNQPLLIIELLRIPFNLSQGQTASTAFQLLLSTPPTQYLYIQPKLSPKTLRPYHITPCPPQQSKKSRKTRPFLLNYHSCLYKAFQPTIIDSPCISLFIYSISRYVPIIDIDRIKESHHSTNPWPRDWLPIFLLN